jgi:rare lipoprotein A
MVTDRSASHAGSRHGTSESNRHAATAAKRTSPTSRSAAAAPGASYGLASYYSYDPKTASGEKFDSRELTAAHRTLPFGTRVRVTNVATGQSVTVRVNDRGPFVPGRVVDVSRGAAETLGIVDRGVAKVKVDVVE